MEATAESPYISARQAATHWCCSPDTIYRWAMKLGWKKVFNPDGGILFVREQVMKCGKARKAQPQP